MTAIWQNLSDAIFDHAARRPEAPALIESVRTLKYGEFAALVGKASAHLRDIGVGPGDRIGIALTNSTDHLILFYALARIGAAPVEISPQATEQERERLAEKFGIRLLFEEPDARAEPSLRTVWLDTGWRAMIAERSGDWRHGGSGDEPYLVGLSSGSTGVPKGVATTHRQLLARFREVQESMRSVEAYSSEMPSTSLLLASLSFTAFRNHAIFAVLSGGPLVLVPELQWPSDLIRAIRSWDGALLMATPGMCRAFKAFARGKGYLFPRVRAMLSAGLPLYAHEKRAVIERVTPNFFEAYGSTASGRISLLRPGEMQAHAESVGRISEGMEVEIVDGRDRPQPAGTVGRLRCRGSTVSKFYLVESDGTRDDGFRDGWYYPGDLASIDESGYLYLHGRSSDLIAGDGVEFLPNEVEAVLTAHASVLEGAVVGRAARDGREEVVALVVTRGAPEHESLAAHLARHLPAAKRPRQIIYAKALPRTPNGKIDRIAVKRIAVRHADPVQ
ncbi:MAG TPA: class I adenylate-forming enzyme family protein [Stellaceae bacterium]|nr:class I adenylate-forming enzyme family protein [Stellaceae bacterium]